jgi:hypothetical protein
MANIHEAKVSETQRQHTLARSLPLARASAVGAAAVLLLGCGPELERVSELQGLRVVAVQKDTPYAAPETDVEFRMLWEDASGEQPRETERFWIGGCANPPGDLYSGCFAQWAEAFASGGGPAPGASGGFFGQGDRFVSTSAPLRTAVQDPDQPLYGLSYVFFGVCAGRVDWQGWAERLQRGEVRDIGSAFPFCLDRESGEPLGIDDYIVGYSSVYSYDGYRNANPVIGAADGSGPAFLVNGEEVAHDCIGDACVCPVGDATCQTPFAAPELSGCVDGVACIAACPKDGDSTCPEVDLRPVLLPELNAEPDAIARDSSGRDVEEALWISYFVDRGAVKSELRLLNDGAAGWNDDYSTKFYAPRDPGPLRIWAVVRDNRGGANWIRVPAYVQ